MPASLRVASHTAPGAARMLAGMRRLHDELQATPGLVAGHLFATSNFWAPASAYLTLRRWALLCAFEDEDALGGFEKSPVVRAFSDRARETWRVTLEPTRVVNGSWRGWCPATQGVEPLAKDEPLAVMTYGILRPRYAPWFLRHNRRIVAASMDQEGLIARFGMADTALTASTFSIWRGHADVARFAYGADTVHKPVIRPSLDTPTHESYFFARFRLRDSDGTLAGRDPVAEARGAPARNGGA